MKKSQRYSIQGQGSSGAFLGGNDIEAARGVYYCHQSKQSGPPTIRDQVQMTKGRNTTDSTCGESVYEGTRLYRSVSVSTLQSSRHHA